MKKYFKELLLRMIIVCITIFVIITILDKIIYINNKEETDWIKETQIINQMNKDKLQNSEWYTDNIIYKHLDDEPLQDKGNKKRILVIGDSVIWGYGYSNANHLWWQQLTRILKEKGYNDVEIIAAGTSGYSTEQYLKNILKNEKVMDEVDADLIIVSFYENDPEFRDEFDQDLVKVIDNNDLFADTNNIFINQVKKLWPNLYKEISNAIVTKYMFEETFQNDFGYEYNLWRQEISKDKWKDEYKKILIELDEYITNNLKTPYFFLTNPSYPAYNAPLLMATNLFNELDIPYYDMTPNFIKKYPDSIYSYKEWGINPGDGHPSVKATTFYSEYVINILEENYQNIIGKKDKNNNIYLEINDWMPYSLKPIKKDENIYKITYPSTNEENAFLTLPINKDYVKLNLKFPIKIKSIEITGNDIKSIHLYTNSINEKVGYDDQVMKDQGLKKDEFIWYLSENEEITSINISVKIKGGKSCDMYIKIEY